MDDKRKVVLITDGDRVARKAVEKVARNVGGRCISLSAGNPTPLSGEQIVELIKTASNEPVLVMLDDRGNNGRGKGENAMAVIARHPDIEVLGVVAVASNTEQTSGTKVDCSVTQTGEIIDAPVDKDGEPRNRDPLLKGDTVDVLNQLHVPVVIGTGDTGKMEERDALGKGVPITTKAVEEILRRSGYNIGD
ncbi:MAG: stage V sporulation protein AE [Bacillota bacterium]